MALLEYRPFKGLHVICKQCNRNIELTQNPYKGCNHPIGRQKYKAVLRVDGRRMTKDLSAKSYDAAVKELLAWKEEINSPLYQIKKSYEESTFLLEDCIYMFSDFLQNIDVPKHEQKIRSEKYVKEMLKYLLIFKAFLESVGYDMDELTVFRIDKIIIGKYYEHLESLKLSPASFNHYWRAIKQFFNYLINVRELVLSNPTKRVKLKYENPDPISISDEDFKKLLSVINDEDSVETLKGANKLNKRNFYRPFIKESFELAAYTGMRIEEVTFLKFKDVVEDVNGNILYLKGTDLKFERSHNMDASKPTKYVYIPITPELNDLLIRMDYSANKGADRYLIDGDETMNRKNLAKYMSHAFTFYRKKAGLPDNISIKHLRKTFLSKLETQTNMSTMAGYQRTPSVTINHYIDKSSVVREIAQRGFRFFK